MTNKPRKKRPDQVAAELLATTKAHKSCALILGAGASVSSGVPLWGDFAQQLTTALEIDVPPGKSAIAVLESHVSKAPASKDVVESEVARLLSSVKPSRGYAYLASLVKEGYYNTIVTTNWDTLLEDALHKVLRTDQMMILTRDLVADDVIARSIRRAGERVVILKLHGDPVSNLRMGEGTSTRSVPKAILEALATRMHRTHIVGNRANDTDIIQMLAQQLEDGDFLVATPNPEKMPEHLKLIVQSVVGGNARVGRATGTSLVNVGEFDHFFCQLKLSLERKIIKTSPRSDALEQIERDLLQKEEIGLSYINSSQLTRMANVFVRQIMEKSTPDIVFFINDPSAPGGMELKKRIEPALVAENVRVGVLNIEGESNNRSFRRGFKGGSDAMLDLTGETPDHQPTNIHILDSITFSGNTLNIAREEVRRWYPAAHVQVGALVVSQMLLRKQATERTADPIYHHQVTDRFEIFFPWGVTQTTADFTRSFEGVDGVRDIEIARRPWGAIEVLVDQELCSVRLLTIEAGRRLSFQRHLVRDELFVALDDNIGLDICAGDLPDDASVFDPRVKSMVLEKGDYILVSRGVWHRTKASMDRARLLEVGFGVYDQQYDIERIFDDFDRTGQDGAV